MGVVVARGPRFLSLSKIVTVALMGLPRLAFDALLKTTLNDSFASLVKSSVTNTVNIFDD